MHDLDRVSMQREHEYEGEGEGHEYEGEHNGEYQGEYAGEYAGEYQGEHQGEYAGEYTGEYQGQGEYASEYGEYEAGGGGVLQEGEVMELATRLLNVSSGQELNRFLAGLVGRGVQAVGRALSSPIGQAVVTAARPLVEAALPALGGAAGQGWGGPAPATTIDPAAARELGLELEGMSYEDRELEVAKQVVRLTSTAGAMASTAPGGAPPDAVAHEAITAAQGQVAPGAAGAGAGLGGPADAPPPDGPGAMQGPPPFGPSANGAGGWARPGPGPGFGPGPGSGPGPGGASSGRWFRRGNRIVLLGA